MALNYEHCWEFWTNCRYSRWWLLCSILIGYALKKVIKLVDVIIGLFLAGLAYLQYYQIANVNWNKLQTISEGALTTLANLTMQIPDITSSGSVDAHAAITASSLAMTCSRY